MNASIFRIIRKILLISILFITFLLSIKQLIPFKSVDETMIAGFVWDLYENPFPVNLYPPFFLYLNFILSFLYKNILIFLGLISTSSQFMSSIGLHFTVEAGRVINAFLAVLLVYLVYRIGNEFYNRNVAFFAAILMAFNHLIILQAHIFKSDILVSLFITLSLYFLLKYLKTHDIKLLLWASFIFGIAVATKYNVYIFILIILLVIFLTRKEIIKKKTIKSLVFLPVVMAAGFFIGAPNWLIHPLKNLKYFLQKYGFGSESVFEPYRIYSPMDIYIKFVNNFIKDFGLIFVIILLLAIPLSFIIKGKKEIILGSFILIYISIFGLMGFYGDRFCIPLYSSIVILIGKIIFVDLKKVFRGNKKAWQIFIVFFWIGTSVFALSNIKTNITTFNQLKTKSKNNWAKDYRYHQGISADRYNIAFQHLTPRIKGGIKLNAKFQIRWFRHSDRIPHFIQAVHQQYLGLTKRDKKQKIDSPIDFSKYKPFYLIQKPRFQPWDIDFIYLYRISEELLQISNPGSQLLMKLPRTYCLNEHTSYFPLQAYEKNPTFGKTVQGGYCHYLYSKVKINKLNMTLFSLNEHLDLNIKINNIERIIKQKNQTAINLIEIGNIKPKKYHKDYVYHIEIQTNAKHRPYYFVLNPLFNDIQKPVLKIKKIDAKTINKPIPELFSDKKLPHWMKNYYKKTGLDLSLLTFIQTAEIFNDSENTLKNIHIDFFPISQGKYKLHIAGHRISKQFSAEPQNTLEYRLFSSTGISKKSFKLNKEFESIQIEINDPINFIEVDVRGLREDNFFIKRMTLVPDYPEIIKADMAH